MAIITRLGKLPKSSWGKGVITHQDQIKLDFKMLFEGATEYFFGMRGEGADVLAWASRVGATQVTKQDIINAVDFESPASTTCDMGYIHPYVKPIIDENI